MSNTLISCGVILSLFFYRVNSKSIGGDRRASKRNTTIVDLSGKFDEASHFNKNPGAKHLLKYINNSNKRPIRGYVVLEHGKKVAEYVRDDLDVNVTTPLWSVTKSWTGLLVGKIIEEGQLRLNETLGDIWPDSSNNIWPNVTDAAYKKNTTIYSLLTMSSGLIDDNAHIVPNATAMYDVGGTQVVDALNYALFLGPDQIGKFNYFGAGNILGYVIKERVGVSPDKYAEKHVMPYIGVKNGDYTWHCNSDGVANTFFGLEMTYLQQAKLGQLYLQNGFTNETNSLISEEWIENSLKHHISTFNPSGPVSMYAFYGYLWWYWVSWDAMCAMGLGGQNVCIWPNKNRVISVVTEFNGVDFGPFTSGLVTLAAKLSFDKKTKNLKNDANKKMKNNLQVTRGMQFNPFEREAFSKLSFTYFEQTSSKREGVSRSGSRSTMGALTNFIMLCTTLFNILSW